MVKQYRSEAFAAIHETMEALCDLGAIDKQTLREFDDDCLTPVHVPGVRLGAWRQEAGRGSPCGY